MRSFSASASSSKASGGGRGRRVCPLLCPTVMVMEDRKADTFIMTSLAVGPDQPARLAGLASRGKNTSCATSDRFCSMLSEHSHRQTSLRSSSGRSESCTRWLLRRKRPFLRISGLRLTTRRSLPSV